MLLSRVQNVVLHCFVEKCMDLPEKGLKAAHKIFQILESQLNPLQLMLPSLKCEMFTISSLNCEEIFEV